MPINAGGRNLLQKFAAAVQDRKEKQLAEARLQKNTWRIDEQWAARAKGFGVADPDEAADIPVFRVVFIEQCGLVSTEYGFVGADRSHLLVINLGHIHREIKMLPSRLHATVTEEKPFNFVWRSILQVLSAGYLVPFRKTRIKHCMCHDVGNRLMIRMHARARGSENNSWTKFSKKPCDLHPDRNRVLNQAVLQRQDKAINPKNLSGFHCLEMALTVNRVAGRFAVAEVNKENRGTLLYEFNGCAPHNNFQIVWMGAKGQNIVSATSGIRHVLTPRFAPLSRCVDGP